MIPSSHHHTYQMLSYREYQHVMRLPNGERKQAPSFRIDKIKKQAKSPSPQQSQRRKITRTKTGCLCCRRRKKKCDEAKPGCSGCVRNNLQCVYPHAEQEQGDKLAAVILSEMAASAASSGASSVAGVANNVCTTPATHSLHTDVPQMTSPSSPHHSDAESPLTSPRLGAHEPLKLVLPLSIDTMHKRTRVQPISVKSLLN